jgi:hypothetical protein
MVIDIETLYMKTILLLTLLNLATSAFAAGPNGVQEDGSNNPKGGPQSAITNTSNLGNLQISFFNHISGNLHNDSVLVIFDKFDHSGAGVIKKIFYPNAQNIIEVTGVPAGKYFVTVQCLGLHHDFMERVYRVFKRKTRTLKVKLEDCEAFSKEKVVIPDQRMDLAELSITKIK